VILIQLLEVRFAVATNDLSGTFTAVEARRSRLILGPLGKTGRHETEFIRRCGLESVTNRLYIYRAEIESN